jgi:hypothetical protein
MKQAHILHNCSNALPKRSWRAGLACIAQLVGGLANDAGPHSHHHLWNSNAQATRRNKHNINTWIPGGFG